MGPTILSVIILIVVVFVIRLAVSAPKISETNKLIDDIQAITDMIERAQHLAHIFITNINSDKLKANNNKYLSYYLSYLDACVKSVCEYNNVKYSDAIRTAIFIEAYKIKNNPTESHEFTSDNIQEGEGLLKELTQTEHGIKGAHDGKTDGDYSNNPSNPAPYFQKLIKYFEH